MAIELKPLRDRGDRKSALLRSFSVNMDSTAIDEPDFTAIQPEIVEINLATLFKMELNEHHRVTNMTEGGSAYEAGVRKLDRILAVDDTELAPGGLDALLAGKQRVTLRLERPPKVAHKTIVLHEYADGSTPFDFRAKKEARGVSFSDARFAEEEAKQHVPKWPPRQRHTSWPHHQQLPRARRGLRLLNSPS